MKASILLALGLMSLMQNLSAADPPTNSAEGAYYYTEGGRNDPFSKLAGSIQAFRYFLDSYSKLPSSLGSSERESGLNGVRLAGEVLINDEPEFTHFFAKAHLPPQALAVSKPLFDALKDEKFRKERDGLVPYPEQGALQTHWFERMDIDHLRKLYALYATLPFPTGGQLDQYECGWGGPGQNPYSLR